MKFNTGRVLEGVSLLAAGVTFGSTFYVTWIENDSRKGMPPSYQLANWHRTFPRAAGFLKPFGMVLNALIGATIYSTGKKSWWGPFGLFGLMGPFTVVFITPTNDTLLLLKEGDAKDEKEAGELVPKWAKLHNVRTVISLFGFAGAIVSAMMD